MAEYPKYLTKGGEEYLIVEDAEAEAAAAKDGWFFGSKPAKKDTK